jgi:ParB family transcriptional regulator, chromosome partitioning protein
VHKRGLPSGLKMRHDSHYVEELTKSQQFIGRIIPISRIEPNPEQPRVEMGDLTELVDSIKEKGVLEPLLVKPLAGMDKWLIIAGERRWRASQLAGLTELPCIELNVSDQEIAEIALIENLQRKDLTVWEEADAYQALCQRFQYTHEDLARKLGKSRSSVTETLTIAALPRLIRDKCVENGIATKASILKIARRFDEDEMLEEINSAAVRDSKQRDERVSVKPQNQKDVIVKSDKRQINGFANPRTSFPLKVFKFNDIESGFQAELKFKKPIGLSELKTALGKIMTSLNDYEE